jgi:hypothetical protein
MYPFDYDRQPNPLPFDDSDQYSQQYGQPGYDNFPYISGEQYSQPGYVGRQPGFPPGQQRAFVMAKVLEHSKVVVVGSECPDIVAACKMIPAANMDEAIRMAARERGISCDVLIVPHALLTLPVVTK